MNTKVLSTNGNPAGIIHVYQSLDYEIHFFN
jgi:hypothetical protein